jgi:putative oxidoreductase
MINRLSPWFRQAPHDIRRSLDMVRVVAAALLLMHPLHALLHPGDLSVLARSLDQRGVPWGLSLAWLAMVILAACSLGLFLRRLARHAAIGALMVLVAGAVLLYGKHWFVVGGAAVEGEPGIEYNLLLITCLSGVLWSHWPRRDSAAQERAATTGFEIIRIGSAALLLPHGLHCFVTWDIAGMREWGEAMSRVGFPFGVALVWSVKGLESLSAIARVSRRLMVPACLGNLLVIVPGMWLAHGLHWFVLGPGEDGVEYSVLLIACAVSCILAYWPTRAPAQADEGAGIGLSPAL